MGFLWTSFVSWSVCGCLQLNRCCLFHINLHKLGSGVGQNGGNSSFALTEGADRWLLPEPVQRSDAKTMCLCNGGRLTWMKCDCASAYGSPQFTAQKLQFAETRLVSSASAQVLGSAARVMVQLRWLQWTSQSSVTFPFPARDSASVFAIALPRILAAAQSPCPCGSGRPQPPESAARVASSFCQGTAMHPEVKACWAPH